MILRDASTRFDVEVLDHLDHDAALPVVTRAACQGDVSILRVTTAGATTAVSEAGVAVVRGENGGNTHSLHGDGPIMWDVAAPSTTSLTLGTLTVPEGSTAILLHPEHGGLAIVPGTYRVGRQREMADIVRMVKD
ncbi:hypothetical protein [Streptacidiphilus sp. EB103A]|uniref:hypothetical protein n=1 Tax=Streptacidiphilus sp. EB103A TaxID=3156275 RepID=UPI00351219A2